MLKLTTNRSGILLRVLKINQYFSLSFLLIKFASKQKSGTKRSFEGKKKKKTMSASERHTVPQKPQGVGSGSKSERAAPTTTKDDTTKHPHFALEIAHQTTFEIPEGEMRCPASPVALDTAKLVGLDEIQLKEIGVIDVHGKHASGGPGN